MPKIPPPKKRQTPVRPEKTRPAKSKPEPLRPRTQDELWETIRLRIARLHGSLNGKRLYLTPDGVVTTIAAEAR